MIGKALNASARNGTLVLEIIFQNEDKSET